MTCVFFFFSSTVELARLVGLLVAFLLSLLRLQLDQVVDSQDGDGGLCGELQALHLKMTEQYDTVYTVSNQGIWVLKQQDEAMQNVLPWKWLARRLPPSCCP